MRTRRKGKRKNMARVLFIIILEALDKKRQPVWLAVRRVRMLVGPLLGMPVARQ